jgi:hypothetical protein
MEDDLLLNPERPPLKCEHILANDGLLHTIDNATNDLGKAMPRFKVCATGMVGECGFRPTIVSDFQFSFPPPSVFDC